MYNMFRFFKRFAFFFKKNLWKYSLGIFFLMFVDIVQLYVPEIIKQVTNEFQEGILTQQRLLFFAILTLLTGLGTCIGRFAWRLFIIGSARSLEYEVRRSIFEKCLTLSQTFFAKNKTGALMALATNDVNAIRMAAFQGIIMAVDASFMLGAVIVKMVLNANLRLTLIALTGFPLMVSFVTTFGKKIHKAFKRVQESYSMVTDNAQETFSGIRVVKGFAQDKEFIDRFSKQNKHYFERNLDMIRLRALFRPSIMLMSSLSFLLVLYFGGNAVLSGEISLGEFIAFNMYLQLMMWPLEAFGMVVNVMQRGSASMERVENLLSEEPEIVDPKPTAESKKITSVVFDNVSFSYPTSEQEAIKDISFTAQAGKSLAIIGSTGSGKTTIVNLLLRLYDKTSAGKILVDGIDIKECSLKNIRESIGIVPQDSFLFSRTINDNIAFDYEDTTQEHTSNEKKRFSYEYLDDSDQFSEDILSEIQHVAKIADIHDNIIGFENSYKTVLGERGVTLSGGQKQRVSIARAIFKKPSILVLDDSFSAVDTETEKNILSNLKQLNKDIGFLIISHRISTIKDCDEILVLDEGRIIERGTDETLMQQQGKYYEIALQQRLEDEIKEKLS